MSAWLLKITYKRIKAEVKKTGLLSKLASIGKKTMYAQIWLSLQAIKNLSKYLVESLTI